MLTSQSETMEAKWYWNDISKVLKETKNLTPEELFKNEGEIKIFPLNQKLSEYVASISTQEMKKRILQANTNQ